MFVFKRSPREANRCVSGTTGGGTGSFSLWNGPACACPGRSTTDAVRHRTTFEAGRVTIQPLRSRRGATARVARLALGSIVAGFVIADAAPGAAVQSDSRAEADVRVSLRARATTPGEVVLVRIDSSAPMRAAGVEAFGKTWPGIVDEDGHRATVLLGLDLDATPGGSDIVVRARVSGGDVVARQALLVEPAHFAARELTVDDRFVNPPPSVRARIEREARLMAQIFATPDPARVWAGPFERPVPGIALSSFGVRSVFNGQARNPHTGTDFRAATGTPVLAPNRGRVRLAQPLYFSGGTVMLDHGQGLFSQFGHLSEIRAKVGAIVERGEEIGLAGATGRVTGPHLHWAVRLGGARVDALSLVEATAAP